MAELDTTPVHLDHAADEDAKQQASHVPPDDSPCNLIVKYLPDSVQSEDGLRELFEPFGPVVSAKLIIDKLTGRSKGYGFIKFSTEDAAAAAVEKMNGASLEQKILRVNIAALGKKERENKPMGQEANLYVARLPFDYNKDRVEELFNNFGEVTDCKLLLDKVTGQPRGVAFVRFTSYQDAANAIRKLHGALPDGSFQPLVVKFANAKGAYRAPLNPVFRPQYPMYQTNGRPGPYGMMPAMYPPPPQGYGPRGDGGYPGNGQFYADGHDAAAYAPQGWGQQMPPPHQHQQQQQQQQHQPQQNSAHPGADQDAAGLFVFHLPPMVDDASLKQLFAPFGHVIQAKVVRDQATGLSRGFGFVNMETPAEAQVAIGALNGFSIAGKHLKVSFKKKKQGGLQPGTE